MRCAPRASNGPDHLGLCALQAAVFTIHKYDAIRLAKAVAVERDLAMKKGRARSKWRIGAKKPKMATLCQARSQQHINERRAFLL